jgi:hypothetical protein
VGGLLGTQVGREVEIMNTFEIVVTEVEGELKVDQAYFVTRKDQCEYSAQGRWRDRADESSPCEQSRLCSLALTSWGGTALDQNRLRRT